MRLGRTVDGTGAGAHLGQPLETVPRFVTVRAPWRRKNASSRRENAGSFQFALVF